MWHWFLALDSARGGNGFGANPIGWAELQAFQQLQSVRLSDQELDCIRQLDRLSRAPPEKKP